jgi:hypothetical protein
VPKRGNFRKTRKKGKKGFDNVRNFAPIIRASPLFSVTEEFAGTFSGKSTRFFWGKSEKEGTK